MTGGRSVSVSWAPPEGLKGWNVSYYALSYSVYRSNSHRAEVSIRRRVEEGQTSETLGVDQLVVREREREEGLTHSVEVVAVLVIEGVEGIGEVRGESATKNITLRYGNDSLELVCNTIH